MALSDHRGFTLIEVAAALAVLGIGVATALRVFSGGLNLSRASIKHTRMAVVARAKLSELIIQKDLKEGSLTGAGDGYAWKADITRFNKDGKLKINPEARILRVDVEVSAPGRDKGFAIATLKTVAR